MAGQRRSRALHYLTMPVDGLWRLSIRPEIAAALAATLALALGLGLLVPQVPAATATDPQGLARWLADLRMEHGPWVAWAERAGLLALHSTLGFRLLWAAAGFAALIAAAERGLVWWHARSDADPPWHLLAHAGLVLLLLAAAAQQRWAMTEERTLLAAARVPAGRWTLYAERFSPSQGTVTIRWQEGEQEGEALLREGQPRPLRGRTLHLTQTGLAVRLRLTDGSGRVLPLDDPSTGGGLQAEALLRFGRDGESRYVSVPEREWLIRVGRPRDLAEPSFVLWVYRGWDTTPLAQASLYSAGELAIGEYRLHWEVLPYAQVRVARNPGLWPGLVGWLLLCAGLAVAATREARAGRPEGPRAMAPLAALGVALGAAVLGAGATVGASAVRGVRGAGAVAALTLLGAAAGLLVAGTVAALLRRPGRREAGPTSGAPALALGLTLWTLAAGPMAVTAWAAGGSPWRWSIGQGLWGLAWCLLVAAWHLRQAGAPRLRLVALGLVALLAVLVAIVGGPALVAG